MCSEMALFVESLSMTVLSAGCVPCDDRELTILDDAEISLHFHRDTVVQPLQGMLHDVDHKSAGSEQ